MPEQEKPGRSYDEMSREERIAWARQNLEDVVQSIVRGDPHSPELLKAADEALARLHPPQEEKK